MPPEQQQLIHSQEPSRKTDGAILSTTVFYDLLKKMAAFARICNQEADIAEYETLASKIKEAYNERFFNKETAQYGNNTVTANILSLRLGLVPNGYEKRVFDNIVKKTESDFSGHEDKAKNYYTHSNSKQDKVCFIKCKFLFISHLS